MENHPYKIMIVLLVYVTLVCPTHCGKHSSLNIFRSLNESIHDYRPMLSKACLCYAKFLVADNSPENKLMVFFHAYVISRKNW